MTADTGRTHPPLTGPGHRLRKIVLSDAKLCPFIAFSAMSGRSEASALDPSFLGTGIEGRGDSQARYSTHLQPVQQNRDSGHIHPATAMLL